MALSPAFTTLNSVFEEEIFSQSITYINDALVPTVPVISGVTTDLNDPGISVDITGNTVTISGKYTIAFPNKFFNYKPNENKTIINRVLYPDVPPSIYTLIKFEPVTVQNRTVTYRVNSDIGTAIITQVVRTNWDTGKAQMYEVLSRSTL